jgi:hypothetical protein
MKFFDHIFFPLRLIDQAISVMWGQGSWSLRPYELKLIEAAAAKLSPENQAILEAQLKAGFFVQRLHQERMTNIHFRWKDKVKRMDLPDDCRLAKIKLSSGRRAVSVSVEAHRGLIFGLHYDKPPKPLVLEDFVLADVTFGGRVDDGIARAIDREEHGGGRPV